jgi:hypothetical protein
MQTSITIHCVELLKLSQEEFQQRWTAIPKALSCRSGVAPTDKVDYRYFGQRLFSDGPKIEQ